jgi:hypothetical protein
MLEEFTHVIIIFIINKIDMINIIIFKSLNINVLHSSNR